MALHPCVASPVSPRISAESSRAGGQLRGDEVTAVRVEALVGEDDDEAEGVFESQEPEEVEKIRILPTPTLPSKSQIEEHEVDHIPHEDWCEHCVSVFGREQAHVQSAVAREIPVISLDYCFLSRRGVFDRGEWKPIEGELSLKVLVVRCSKSKAVFAHAVPVKGVDPQRYIIDCVVDDVSWLGHVKVLIKSDNEPALAQVVSTALSAIRIRCDMEQVGEEHSIPYDPKTNGAAELGVKLVKGQLLVLKLGLEKKLGHRVPVTHPLLTWLVQHAADVRTFRVKDRVTMKTPYQFAKGRPFATRLLAFGESCRFKLRMNEGTSTDRPLERWGDGIFLGICKMTGQYRLFSNGAIRYARTVMRKPTQEKWNLEEVQKVDVSTWRVHKPRDVEPIHAQKFEGEDGLEAAIDSAIKSTRRAPIKEKDLKDFGYTDGCPKCRNALKYGYGRGPSSEHNDACRKRIYTELSKTDEGRERLSRMDARLNQYMELVKEREEARAKGESVGVGHEASHEGESPTRFEKVDDEDDQDKTADSGSAHSEVLRPERVVTAPDQKAEYDRQLREAMKHMRSGAPMPVPQSPGGEAVSGTGGMDVDVVECEHDGVDCEHDGGCNCQCHGCVNLRKYGPQTIHHVASAVGSASAAVASSQVVVGEPGRCRMRCGADPGSPAVEPEIWNPAGRPVDLRAFLQTRQGSNATPTEDPIGSKVQSPGLADETGDRWSIFSSQPRTAVKSKPIGTTPWSPARRSDLGKDFPRPNDADICQDDHDRAFHELLAMWTVDEQKVACEIDNEIMQVLDSLGGSSRRFRRERVKQLKAIITEVYSPPRVGAAARLFPGYNCAPGMAFDLTVADEHGRLWDFDDEERQNEAWRRIKKEKPTVLIGTPMCTAFSRWHNLSRNKVDPVQRAKDYAKALKHIEFCCRLYKYQMAEGRYFVHEHPIAASSWQESAIVEILNMPSVGKVSCDQCQVGAQDLNGCPIRKPTRFMSNSEHILKALEIKCHGKSGWCSRPEGGQHVACSGMTARRAAIFPLQLCRAILVGIRNQMKHDRRVDDTMIGFHDVVDEASPTAEVMKIDSQNGPFFDDITGQPLNAELVRAARQKELEYFNSKGVWSTRPSDEAVRVTGRKPISVRWVDTNKGDDDCPNIRSRLVAREIRPAGVESIFAPTPPLEALRTVLSLATTKLPGDEFKRWEPEHPERMQISLVDISRAYFNARVDEATPTYVQLPVEHSEAASGKCAFLHRHMYGTQRAADGWQCEYSATLRGLGFTQGVGSPCVFWHKAKRIVCSVHGDDFTSAGPKPSLDWFESELAKHYELTKGGRLGPGVEDDHEARILNRIVRWTSKGLEYEADPRQGERLLEDLELTGDVKAAPTPGVKPLQHQIDTDKSMADQTKYRAIAARGNYLAADRPDMQFAAKEICRFMSSPTELGWTALKRLGRYIVGRPRLIHHFPYQEATGLEGYSDTDWAGCLRTRKSTSGGLLLLGDHVLKTWSSTQASVSLSSGEAEFYGVVRASGIALGHQSILKDLGYSVPVRIWTDSSAAIGICSRSGLGKLRHIDTQALWVQSKVKDKEIDLRKVRGDSNPADLLTKFLSSREKLNELVQIFGGEFRDGRAASAPLLRRQGGQSKSQPSMSVNPEALNIDLPDRPREDQVDEHGVREAAAHDPRRLPHRYPAAAIEWMFPAAQPPEVGDGICDFEVPTSTKAPTTWKCPSGVPSAAGGWSRESA